MRFNYSVYFTLLHFYYCVLLLAVHQGKLIHFAAVTISTILVIFHLKCERFVEFDLFTRIAVVVVVAFVHMIAFY